MYLSAKIKRILEYYQEQITLLMNLIFSAFYILENEFDEFYNFNKVITIKIYKGEFNGEL